MLRVCNVSHYFGDLPALRAVNLDVPTGNVLALLGPNGAGKSTLISIIAGLRRPSDGLVRVGGGAGLDPMLDRTDIGWAPQEVGIYPSLSVYDNLMLFAELHGLRRQAASRRIAVVAEMFDLVPFVRRNAGDLSGGQKRRLHASIALVHSPSLVLLDEPTAGVDVESRTRLLSAIKTLADQENVSIIYTTHYLQEVDELAPEIAILNRGQVVARGSLDELRRKHAQPAVELEGDGRAPSVPRRWKSTVNGNTTRVICTDPSAELRDIVASATGAPIRSIHLRIADTDAVYRSIVGQSPLASGPNA